jgi:hypothetical protein
MNGHSIRLLLVLSLLLVVGLPFAAKLSRPHAGPRCALDGLAIEPLYQVRIVSPDGEVHRFCCPGCARSWLDRQENRSGEVFVTDEASGEEAPASSASYVESAVVTNPITRNRIHTFRNPVDAQEHARNFAGRVLGPLEGPIRIDADPDRRGRRRQ